MYPTTKNLTISALLATMLVSACVTEPGAEDQPSATTDQYDAAHDAVTRANSFLEGIRGSSLAREWKDARIVEPPRALHRPDLNGPAYYEFRVEPSGFIIVATGQHDVPVAHWSSKGTAPSERLLDKAGAAQVTRFYKLDTLTYAAEDRDEQLVAQLGRLPQQLAADPGESELGGEIYTQRWTPTSDGGELVTREVDTRSSDSATKLSLTDPGAADQKLSSRIVGKRRFAKGLIDTSEAFEPTLDAQPFDSWKALKAGYARAFDAHLAELSRSAAQRWKQSRTATVEKNNGWRYWEVEGRSGAEAQTRSKYSQIEAYTYNNPTSCLSGCGATAWSMLFAWVDKRAHKSVKWSNHQGIYRYNGGRYTSPATVAPEYNDYGVRNMMMEIRSYIGTFCMFNNGATYPSTMGNAAYYLSGRDYSPMWTAYNGAGFSEWSITQASVNSIIVDRTPAIIGVGWLTHYPLAVAFATHPYDGSYFLVNQGWGNWPEEYVPAASWFHGQVVYTP